MNKRLAGAGLLGLVMFVFLRVAPGPFVMVVAAALIIGPIFPWRAFIKLHGEVRWEERNRLPNEGPVVALTTARNSMLAKAIGVTVTAWLALFVVGRELGWLAAMERTDFLFFIAYPPLLAIWPAIDWLRTVGRLQRSAGR